MSEVMVDNSNEVSITKYHHCLSDFEKRTYNGFDILVHVQTNYINATKLCHDVSLKEGKHIKQFKNIKVSPQFNDYCDYLYEESTNKGSAEFQPTINTFKTDSIYNDSNNTHSNVKEYLINPSNHDLVENITGKGFNNDVKGQYIHPDLLHFVLTLTSIKYLRITTKLMNSIDNKVHEELKKRKLNDVMANAEPIFIQTVSSMIDEANKRGQEAFEAQYCWGYRD